ncbi:MAG: (Protein ADP-ribosylglutamate) hydrolase [Methanoregula sp. PtaU1.Bin051]|nr:MAG: (Protein ADP-ribosylglutamate) hydrolase [Methanoregula sp. PtaU1.Bin051]
MPVRIVDRISVVEGDITQQQVDAIVNAANQTLLGGGGVDGAIHRAAGPELLEECRSLGGCRTGEAKITKGYRLPAGYIIHTVGPVWSGGLAGEDELLASCYRKSLMLAESHDMKTIAFPAISTGAYGFPLARATLIAVRTVLEFLSQSPGIEQVVFVCHGDRAFRIYNDALRTLAGKDSPSRQPEMSTSTSEDRESSGISGEIRRQVDGQLLMIESVHGIRIVNRDRLLDKIIDAARDTGHASRITAALNSWVAVNGITGDAEIPAEVIRRILARTGP